MRYATTWRRFAPSALGGPVGSPARRHGVLGDSASSMCASRLARLLLHVPGNVRHSQELATELAKRPFAGRTSEDADAVERPVGREHLADDPRARDRAPVAAVVGVATV